MKYFLLQFTYLLTVYQGPSLDRYLTTRQKTLFTHNNFSGKAICRKTNQDIMEYLLWQRKQDKAEPTITCRVGNLRNLHV